ncbi:MULTISPECIES: lipoprotein NlpI [Shewanella]|uniref:Lipoprotein NlpI n=1 Tax=Shewanella seohaensis TaxID=755175 RepID=A0ABV4VRB1_9GAMM|nr:MULTISPECIES: lipoprotein NlpI [Shewanella]QXN24073.1 lipoprotein NlpI [Shewanella putrefaciens]MCL1118964.1 lipoprotein NlpI [Shewanella seohaensis]MDH1469381.1 lipoprotein NlpI [Shewanella sp. GD03713]PWF62835.1 lipoprotein NlpI [Shewanella sp. BC20]UXM81608.1 lipoprotein NlpI [Shewanella seohaensis]
MSLKIRTAVVAVLAGASLMLAGCATTKSPLDNQNDVEGKLVIAPVMPDYKVEVTLAKLNEILSAVELTNEQRARFHYDRGVIYDSVGLRLMARIDFMQALKLQPDLADAYNFLGIYYTQEGEYDSAYEAFDGVLELSPNYDYAYLNRGIALYYGDRNDLALKDMQAFYAGDNKDGYRALWLYLIQSKDNAEEAKRQLQEHRKGLEADAWSTVIVDYYLGVKSREQVFADAKLGLTHPKEYAERLCEAYFYLAKIEIAKNQYQEAANYFRLALATNIYDFVEHRYARIELAKVKGLLEGTK